MTRRLRTSGLWWWWLDAGKGYSDNVINIHRDKTDILSSPLKVPWSRDYRRTGASCGLAASCPLPQELHQQSPAEPVNSRRLWPAGSGNCSWQYISEYQNIRSLDSSQNVISPFEAVSLVGSHSPVWWCLGYIDCSWVTAALSGRVTQLTVSTLLYNIDHCLLSLKDTKLNCSVLEINIFFNLLQRTIVCFVFYIWNHKLFMQLNARARKLYFTGAREGGDEMQI